MRLDQRAKKSAWNPWDSLRPAKPKSCPEDSLPIPNLWMERSFPCSLLGFSQEFWDLPNQSSRKTQMKHRRLENKEYFGGGLWLCDASQVEFQREVEPLAAAGGWRMRLFLLRFQRQKFLPKIPRQAQGSSFS